MEQRCKNCLLYQLIFQQPDYLVDGKEVFICDKYKESIPEEIWNGKTECDDYLSSTLDDNK